MATKKIAVFVMGLVILSSLVSCSNRQAVLMDRVAEESAGANQVLRGLDNLHPDLGVPDYSQEMNNLMLGNMLAICDAYEGGTSRIEIFKKLRRSGFFNGSQLQDFMSLTVLHVCPENIDAHRSS